MNPQNQVKPAGALKLPLIAWVFFFLAVVLSPAGEYREYVPHVTPTGAWVATSLVITNHSSQSNEIRITGREGYERIPLNAGEVKEVAVAETHGFPALVVYKWNQQIDVQIKYQAPDGAAALVPTCKDPATVHRFQTPDITSGWLGLAMVQFQAGPVDVTLTQYSHTGKALAGYSLNADAAFPGGKFQAVLATDGWVSEEDTYFEIVTSKPTGVTVLHGSMPEASEVFLRPIPPVIQLPDRISLEVLDAGGERPLLQTVTIENGRLVFESTRPDVTPGIVYRFKVDLADGGDGFWALLNEKEAFDFQIISGFSGDGACDPTLFYTLEIGRGARRNAFFTDGCTLSGYDKYLEAQAICEGLLQLARDLASDIPQGY